MSTVEVKPTSKGPIGLSQGWSVLHRLVAPHQGWPVLRKLVAPHWGLVTLLSLTSLVSALLEASFIVLLTGIVTALIHGNDTVGPAFGRSLPVTWTLLLAAAALIVRMISGQWGVLLAASLTAKVTTLQRQLLSHAYLRSSWSDQQTEPSGRLQQLLTTFVDQIAQAVSTLAVMITAGLSLLAFLIMGFAINVISTAAVLIALTVMNSVLTPLQRAIKRRSGKNASASIAFANAVSELGSLCLEMQTYGAESSFEARIDELTRESTLTRQRTQFLQGAVPLLYISLAYGVMLVGVALLSVTGGFSSIGIVGAVMLLLLRSLSYGQQLASSSATLVAALPFLEGVEQTVERYAASRVIRGHTLPAAMFPLEVHDLAYSYSSDRMALAGVNVTLGQGEALGVIGPSGAGKSTLAQLLLGLRKPLSGEILVAGTRLDEIDQTWWAERVAFVAQEANLFTGTVADNIRFFRHGIDEEALRRAASQANILDEIESLPHGFNTHLGERGSQLSGGQKQRLSIARALASRPELLILDEPTSALDGQSESLIRSTLVNLKGQLSVVLIAHRMSTLEICDRIMVIEAGQMTAIDTPTALHANSEFYRNALAVAGIA